MRFSYFEISMHRLSRVHLLFLVLSCFFCSDQKAYAQSGQKFWSYWGNGQAELNSYALEVKHAGRTQTGFDVYSYVTKHFGLQQRAVVDGPLDPHDQIAVLALVQTRIYKSESLNPFQVRHVLSPIAIYSVDSHFQPAILPIRVAFFSGGGPEASSEQLDLYFNRYKRTLTPSEQTAQVKIEEFQLHDHAFLEEDIFIRTRELNAPFPSNQYKVLRSGWYTHQSGESPEWLSADVTRFMEDFPLKTAIGEFHVIRYEIAFPGRHYRIWTEAQGAKRILDWQVRYGGAELQHSEHGRILASLRAEDRGQTDLMPDALRESLKIQ